MPALANIGVKAPEWDKGRWKQLGCLGRNIEANYVSPWFPLDGVSPATLTVTGTFDATVTFYVRNERSLAAPDADVQVGAPIAGSPGSVMLDGPFSFVAFIVTDYVSGTVRSVDLFARDRGAQN